MSKLIPLTQGYEAIVDDADFEWLSQFKWCYSSKGYAVRRGQQKALLMHRVILQTPSSLDTDHINRNRLDNRRSNLRIVTTSQNLMNKTKMTGHSSSIYKGVSLLTPRETQRLHPWRACIRFGSRFIHIGLFLDEIEAAKAYDAKARELFGEFAYLNFPDA